MAIITRTYTFTDGTVAYGSQVDSEIQNIANVLNSLDAATTSWDSVKVVNSSSTPLIVDNSSGSNSIVDFRANGVSKFTIGSTGAMSTTIAMGSNKITGLANGTASTDAAAFGQLPNSVATTTWSPTITGFGTAANIKAIYAQIGSLVIGNLAFQAGTTSGTTASFTLPVSLNSAYASCVALGVGANIASGALFSNQPFLVFNDGSSLTTAFLGISATGGNASPTKATGSQVAASSSYTILNFCYGA